MPSASKSAATFGHSDAQILTARDSRSSVVSSASRPLSARRHSRHRRAGQRRPWRDDLLAQRGGDLGRQLRDRPILDASRSGEVDLEDLRHAAGPAAEQHDAVAQPRRLAHVVGDEHDRRAGGAARSTRARRASRHVSSRRAPRTVRPSTRCRRPGRACGPARLAAASRPTARADACRRSPTGARAPATRRLGRVGRSASRCAA